MDCRDCIHYERCDTVFDGLLSNRDNEPCWQFDSKYNYLKWPCEINQTIYFIGYGVAETLKVEKMTVECSEHYIDKYLGYVDARREDGTTESIGFNVFGELAFINKEDAEKALEDGR